MASEVYLQRLHELLDGDLPVEQEEELFWKLASEEELRAAFREFVLLNRLLRHDPVPPPAHVQESLLQRLGLVQSRSAFRQPRLWLAALLGALGGAGLVTVVFLLLGTPERQGLGWGSSLAPVPVELTLSIPKTLTAPSGRAVPVGPALPPVAMPEFSPHTAPAPSLTPAELHPLPLAAGVDSPFAELPSPPRVVAPYRETPAVFFSLRSLGAWELTSPDVVLPSRAPIGIRDLAVGLWKPLTPRHAIGVEVGAEVFPQEFSTSDGVLYRQRPTLLWAGPSYWWNIASTPSGVAAELHATVGATLVGPVGKLWLGASVPLGASAQAIVGLEGSLLGYRVDGTWFVSRKLGVSYGVALGR